MNFEVGDTVTGHGASPDLLTVTAVGKVGNRDVFAWKDGYLCYSGYHELVERRKPTYRIRRGSYRVTVDTDSAASIAAVYFGGTSAAKTVEEAEAAVRAAMGALGYEEEKN